jgi:cytoskeleton protein RodZ
MTESTSESTTRANDNEQKETFNRIGRQLRQRREAMGLDQRAVARELNLPGIVIDDLESGRLEHLSGLYRRGYVKNYAVLLELDPEPLLAALAEERPPLLHDVLPVADTGWRLERYLKVATYVLVTTAIVPPLLYFFIAGGSSLLQGEGADGVEPERTAAAADAARDGGVEPAREPGDEPGHVTAATLPLNAIRPAAETRPEAGPQAPSSEPEAVPPGTRLGIELIEDSWIEVYDAAEQRLEYDLLRAGQSHHYTGEPPFRLLIGKASAVDLRLDDEPVEWPGQDAADVAEIRIAADGSVID